MGHNKEEDDKSDNLALRDSMYLLKAEIHERKFVLAEKRIDYIIKMWFL